MQRPIADVRSTHFVRATHAIIADIAARHEVMLSAGAMSKARRYLTATLPDGYIKTIGPTTEPFTHYWRIVANLENGKTDIFWGHTKSFGDAKKKRAAAADAAKMRGWKSYAFEIVALDETPV